LVATLLVEGKTYCHLAQTPQCLSSPPLWQARVPSPSKMIMEQNLLQ
jgi:hypothetical protein